MSDAPEMAVLVMDDDEDVRFIAGHLLNRLGFKVVLASNGTEAIDRYSESLSAGKRFHAVILDSSIPGGLGGCDVLERLKSIDPLVHAFISSGNHFDPAMVTPSAYGFAGALDKPYTTSSLRSLLPPETV